MEKETSQQIRRSLLDNCDRHGPSIKLLRLKAQLCIFTSRVLLCASIYYRMVVRI